MFKELAIAQGGHIQTLTHNRIRQDALCMQWTGDRTVLLFLPPHGAGSEIWIRVMQRLKGIHDCVALDAPNFTSPEEATLDNWVALVTEWISLFARKQKVALVGSSLGGIVSMRAAARCGPLVERVITLGLHPSMGSLHSLAETFDVASAADLNVLFQRTWARPPDLSPALETQLLVQMQSKAFKGLLQEISRCDLNTEFHEAVSKGVSVRFLMGREDRITEWNATGCVVEIKGNIISDCGHYPQSEQPKTCAGLIVRSIEKSTEKGGVKCHRR